MRFIGPTSKQSFCKSCFKEFRAPPYRRIWEKEPLICHDCLSQLKNELSFRKVEGINVYFLCFYDGIMKQWLMNYKEAGDSELAPVFFSLYLPLIHLFFPFSLFVPCPSSQERISKRGFDHLPMILEASHLPYRAVLKKGDKEEQKEKKGSERFAKKGIGVKEEGKELIGKRIVLFDDVLTTGSTFLQSASALQGIGVRSISGLILMDNQKLEERRIKGSLFN